MSDILNSEETAKVLGISRGYLYKLMENGDLHPIEKESILSRRGRLEFRRSEVEALRQRRLQEKQERDKEAHSRKRVA